MSHFSCSPWLRGLAGCITLCCSVLVAPRAAANALQETTSLKFAPADVSVYVSGMRMREVFDKVVQSKALAQLTSLPAVQFAVNMARAQWQSNAQSPQLAPFTQMLSDPANQQLIALLKDAVSHEVFLYGDQDLVEAATLMGEINAAASQGQMEAIEAGEFQNTETYAARNVAQLLAEKEDPVKVPRIVIGMKLSNAQTALDQLQRLETVLQGQLQQQPELLSRLAREQLGGGEFLTFRLDGTLLSASLLAAGDADIDPEVKQQAIDKIQGVEMSVSLGVREDYVLVSLGPDNTHLATLGEGALLDDRDEMAPVRDAAEKPIVQVVYATAELLRGVSSMDRQLDQMVTLVKQFAPMYLGDAPELQEELNTDVEKLAAYVKDRIPDPGTITSYQFLTAEGLESFTYNWDVDSPLDASQQLPILQHVGGDPLAFWAARAKSDPQDLEDFLLFMSRAAYYGDQIAMRRLDETQAAEYEQVKADMLPLLQQLATVTRDKLGPALQDGQSAIVMDAKSTSAAWHNQLPPMGDELPMLEIAVVMGVSDAAAVRDAFSQYFQLAQGILDQVHELSTGVLRDYFNEPFGPVKLVAPVTESVSGGTVYFYPLPSGSGVDKQLAPNGGLSESYLAFSLLPRFTERLLADAPLQGSGPLADTNRPLAAAFHLDFAGLLGAISPWIDYGLALSMPPGPDGNSVGMFGDVPQQVRTVIEVLQCFQGASGVTYAEDNAMVTHSQWRFVDLP